MIGATEQGRLFVFPAEVEPHFDEDQLVDEQVETKHILIVAHEVSSTQKLVIYSFKTNFLSIIRSLGPSHMHLHEPLGDSCLDRRSRR